MEFLFSDWLGKPLWMWLAFMGIVVVLLALDLGVLHRKQREIGVRESLALSAGYIALGLGFGGWVSWYLGQTAGRRWNTGKFKVAECLVVACHFTFTLQNVDRNCRLVVGGS